MSESKRSFFSTIPGLVTGIAGLLTGIVGIVTVLMQLGVLGGNGDGGATTTTTSASAAGGASGGSAATEAPRLTVDPSTLEFKSGEREKTVRVKNQSTSTALSVSSQVAGTDRAQFSVSPGNCSSPVRPGLSCELRVTFTPGGALRSFSAVLEVTAPGAQGEEVRLTATTILS